MVAASRGSRRIAANMMEPKLEAFTVIATNLLQWERFADAYDLVWQAVRTVDVGFDNMVRKAQPAGQSIHADDMSADADFGRDCGKEWGRGGGYRDRIHKHNSEWFEDESPGPADARVHELIAESCQEVIGSVRC
jgi:hypothetical protein